MLNKNSPEGESEMPDARLELPIDEADVEQRKD